MSYKNDEIIRLLKRGRSEEVRSYFDTQKKENYPEDFSMFMEQMIADYHIKRKEIAVRSGLSQDYTYKLLRGTKKTSERDYILAICIAIGMNIPQTQHALDIYGMPMLNRADLRSNVIYLGIEEHRNIDTINEWLEKAGFVYIKVSPDMPSASIEICKQSDIEEKKFKHIYKEIDRQIEAEQCGNAPTDYDYWGRITVEDETGAKYYVEAAYMTEGENLIVMDEENYKKSIAAMQSNCKVNRDFFSKHPELNGDMGRFSEYPELLEEYFEFHRNNMPEVEIMEEYNSLLEASESDFFKFFLELDHATDKKVEDTLSFINDTRNYGLRIGAMLNGNHKVCYLEFFNNDNPAAREYLQIVQTDGNCIYTASHESYFMRNELEGMYPLYYGEIREPEYYIKVENTTELYGNNIRLRFLFDELRLTMLRYEKSTFKGLFDMEDEDLTGEMVRTLIQRATWLYHKKDYEESLKLLQESIGLIEEAEEKGEDYSIVHLLTYSKIANIYGNMGNVNKQYDIYEKIYLMKNRITEIMKSGSAGTEDVLWSMAEVMINKAQRLQQRRGPYDPEAKSLIEETIEILEGNCTCEQSFSKLMTAYTIYAYMIDVDEPEQAVKYCRKAVSISNAYHMDKIIRYQNLVVSLYNNYAWVLWNKLGSEEAVIYYGRAIELLESFMITKSQTKEYIVAQLHREGEALYKIYVATNKKKEADMLRERLAENGVEI